MTFFAILIAIFLAMNVGANNSAAEMGAAYGAGVRTKKEALTLIAIFAILGAIIAGLPVIKTLGGGLVPERTFKAYFYIIFVVMAVAAFFDFLANIFKVPIPTTHAIVCSIVGAGLYYKSLSVQKFLTIVSWWIISPIVAFILAYIIGKYLYFKVLHHLSGLKSSDKIRSFLGAMLTFSGCYVAFSGGANGAAKAMGPIVAAGIIDHRWGVLLGGAGISIGALLFGGGVLETVGKGITEIGVVRAIFVEFICATIVFLASLSGIPVSISETVTSSVIGLSCAKSGFRQTARNQHVIRIGFFWLGVPLASIGLTYLLLHILSLILK